MKKPVIAVLGATGGVGTEILKILGERGVEFSDLKLLASEKSAGKEIEFNGKIYVVERATPESFDGVDIVLASAGKATSLALAPEAARRGAVYIDNSSAFRMDKDVPLVIVGVNDGDIAKHKGIIGNPNCSTSQLMLVLRPLHDAATIKRLIVSTYQSVSGAGLAAIKELDAATSAALAGEKFAPSAFKKNIAFNVIPQIDAFDDNKYTKEEMKVVNETRKIMHLSNSVPISCTAVRVPVFIGHSEAVDIEFEKPIDENTAREILSNAYGVKVVDDIANFVYPVPIDAAGTDPVYVGRIRKNIAFENGIALWCVADNLRIGAALNAVRIAEKIIDIREN